MSEVFREVATGSIDADRLGKELSATSSGLYYCNIEVGIDLAGAVDAAKDRLRIYSENAVNEASVDAALAAYPSTATPVANTFAMATDTQYVLQDEPIAEGELVMFDVHLLMSLGTAATFVPAGLDWYVLAWRETNGSVQAEVTSSLNLGKIPGLRISAVGGPTSMQIVVWSQRAGAFTIHRRDIKEWGRGRLS